MEIKGYSTAQFPFDHGRLTGFIIADTRPARRQVCVVVRGIVRRLCGRWRLNMTAEVRGDQFYVDNKLVYTADEAEAAVRLRIRGE